MEVPRKEDVLAISCPASGVPRPKKSPSKYRGTTHKIAEGVKELSIRPNDRLLVSLKAKAEASKAKQKRAARHKGIPLSPETRLLLKEEQVKEAATVAFLKRATQRQAKEHLVRAQALELQEQKRLYTKIQRARAFAELPDDELLKEATHGTLEEVREDLQDEVRQLEKTWTKRWPYVPLSNWEV